jgi:hypothetical protein
MIRVELLQNEEISWPSTMLRKDSQNEIMPGSSCLVCHGQIACGRGLCVLVIQCAVVHLTTLSGNLWAVTLLWVVCPYPNFVSIWLPSAVSWRSTKIATAYWPHYTFVWLAFLFGKQKEERHAIYQAKTVKPQKETLPFMSKPPPFSHIPLIDIQIWGCSCSQFQVNLLLRNTDEYVWKWCFA